MRDRAHARNRSRRMRQPRPHAGTALPRSTVWQERRSGRAPGVRPPPQRRRGARALWPRERRSTDPRCSVTPDTERDVLSSAAADPEAQRLRTELRAERHALAQALDAVPALMTMRELPANRGTTLPARPRLVPLAPGEAGRARHAEPASGSCRRTLPPNRAGPGPLADDAGQPALRARERRTACGQLALRSQGLVATAGELRQPGDAAGRTPSSWTTSRRRASSESGWDVKAFLRRLVLSATYRQSSRASEELRSADPDNLLLASWPQRLPAGGDDPRQRALRQAGSSSRSRGGPPVQAPTSPPGLWKEKSGVVYKADEGEGLWRRSLYTFWKRTSPPHRR